MGSCMNLQLPLANPSLAKAKRLPRDSGIHRTQ
jgi:hypothetical protein